MVAKKNKNAVAPLTIASQQHTVKTIPKITRQLSFFSEYITDIQHNLVKTNPAGRIKGVVVLPHSATVSKF